MNKYMIFTSEGHCSAPNLQDINAYQLLGFVEAESEEQALDLAPYEAENISLETGEVGDINCCVTDVEDL